MAFLMTHFWPGGTMDQYNATVAVLHPPHGLPEGQLCHAAGPTDGGVLVGAVWESEEHFERFLSDRVMASMPIEGGLSGQPEQRTADIENLVRG
jgi:hypothetical protein